MESCRRDLLDHVIAMNERHLKRLLAEYVHYYHERRTHWGLGKGTSSGRICSRGTGPFLSQERLGGLHHLYDRAAQSGPPMIPPILTKTHCLCAHSDCPSAVTLHCLKNFLITVQGPPQR